MSRGPIRCWSSGKRGDAQSRTATTRIVEPFVLLPGRVGPGAGFAIARLLAGAPGGVAASPSAGVGAAAEELAVRPVGRMDARHGDAVSAVGGGQGRLAVGVLGYRVAEVVAFPVAVVVVVVVVAPAGTVQVGGGEGSGAGPVGRRTRCSRTARGSGSEP